MCHNIHDNKITITAPEEEIETTVFGYSNYSFQELCRVFQLSKAFWGLMYHPSKLTKGLDHSHYEMVSKEETIGQALC